MDLVPASDPYLAPKTPLGLEWAEAMIEVPPCP